MLTQWIYVWFQVLEVFDCVSFLFLIYINDIVNDIHANIRLFADDTSLYIIVDEPIQASTVLNTDLTKIITWSKTWLVLFNPSKSEYITFSRNRNKPLLPPLLMDNKPITEVTTHKHLDLTISNDAKWNAHLTITLDKAWRRIGILRSLKLPRSSLEKNLFLLRSS